MGHAPAGGRSQPAVDTRVAGTQLTQHHQHLHSSDRPSRATGSRSDQSGHGRAVMVELAAIFRQHGAEYQRKYGERMPSSHLRALRDIQRCRTEELGGQVYHCDQCKQYRYSYHSCKNRHCPKCQNDQANQWLEEQKSLLLPVTYFLVTFTLPAELRPLARSNQKTIYNLLFRASSAALLQLAQDPRFGGGRIGMVGVLHTWTRQLSYHPHVHYLVTGGGLPSGGPGGPPRQDFPCPP